MFFKLICYPHFTEWGLHFSTLLKIQLQRPTQPGVVLRSACGSRSSVSNAPPPGAAARKSRNYTSQSARRDGAGRGGADTASFPEAKAETKESHRRPRPHTGAGAHSERAAAPGASERAASRDPPGWASRIASEPSPQRSHASEPRSRPPPASVPAVLPDPWRWSGFRKWVPGPGLGRGLRPPAHAEPGGGLRVVPGGNMKEGWAGAGTRGQGCWRGQRAPDRWGGSSGRSRALEVLGGRGPAVRSLRTCARSPGRRSFRSPDLPEICASRSRLNFVLYRASFGPCHAAFSKLFLKPVLFYVLVSLDSRGGQGRCGGPAAFLRGALGFVLSLLWGWLLLTCPNGLEKPVWGREASCPFYFGPSAAATSGHIAVVKT